MKKIITILSLFILNTGFSQDDEYEYNEPEITETQPYFKVLNKDAKIDRIPLLLTTVDAEINGFMAEVTVTQYYKNDGDMPLEAQYVFPGSTDAAVHEVKMTVGDRVIMAEIQKKKEARATYEKAKKEGKTTSLLEQSDPGLFTMNLANILPGDDITVTLSYTEKIVPSKGKYTFRYPAVGRESVLARGSTGVQSYKPGDNMGFDLSVRINSPVAIADLQSKNHKIDTEFHSNNKLTVNLDTSEQLKFDEDFIFEYDLRDKAVNSGLLLHQDEDNGYFLLTVQPPAKFKSNQLLPREYIFVVDSSGSMGSMGGQPIENAKYITQSLMSDLSPEEYFNVVLFAGGSKVFSDTSQQVNQADISDAMKMVSVSSAGGGTDLFGALEKINQIPRIEGISRTLVIMTDGAISVPDRTIDLLMQTENQNVFVIGVSGGYSNDVATIKSLALAGQGQPFFIQDDDQDIEKIQQEFLDYVRYPLLNNIKVESIGFDELDLQPTHIVDLFADRPVFITGKFKGKQRGSIRITGQGNGSTYDQLFDLDGLADQNNQSVKYLWAREKINRLSLNEHLNEGKITKMGLDHNLMTPYTSFVAVDEVERNDERLLQKVAQAPSMYGYGYAESSMNLTINRMATQAPYAPLSTLLKPVSAAATHNTTRRQNITFIMGKDKPGDNNFYQLATDLFQHHPQHKTSQVVHLSELADIKDYLKLHANDKPWGLINVVAHSSPWSGIQQNNTSVAQSMNYFNINTLINSNHKPLGDNVMDSLSEIRVIGCAVGSQKNFLQALSIYFGGNDSQKPEVKAPNDYVYLTSNLGKPEMYSLQNPWFLSHPEQVSDDVTLTSLLGKHAPNPQYINPKHWLSLPIEISLPVPNISQRNTTKLNQLASQQIELVNFLDDLSASVEDFDWVISSDKTGKQTLTGKSILVKFKVPTGDITDLLNELDFNDNKLMSESR